MPRHRGIGLVRQPQLAQRAGPPFAARLLVRRGDRQEPVLEQAQDVRARDLVTVCVPPTTARPPPSIVSATRSARRPTATAPWRRCTAAGATAAATSERRAPRRSSTSVASARSRLSPPSSRCSPMATRSNPSSPVLERHADQAEIGRAAADVADEHAIAVAEVIGEAAAVRAIQAYNAACGSSISMRFGNPACVAAATVSSRAASSNDAGTVRTICWASSRRAASSCARVGSTPRGRASRYRADASTGDSARAPRSCPNGRIGPCDRRRRSQPRLRRRDLRDGTSAP